MARRWELRQGRIGRKRRARVGDPAAIARGREPIRQPLQRPCRQNGSTAHERAASSSRRSAGGPSTAAFMPRAPRAWRRPRLPLYADRRRGWPTASRRAAPDRGRPRRMPSGDTAWPGRGWRRNCAAAAAGSTRIGSAARSSKNSLTCACDPALALGKQETVDDLKRPVRRHEDLFAGFDAIEQSFGPGRELVGKPPGQRGGFGSNKLSIAATGGLKMDWTSAVKLIDGLAGVRPAGASCPVGTVVISGGGAGDQAIGSPEVNVLDGWVQTRSAPTGGLAKQQVVAQANRRRASKTIPSLGSECEGQRECPKSLVQVEGQRLRRSTG